MQICSQMVSQWSLKLVCVCVLSVLLVNRTRIVHCFVDLLSQCGTSQPLCLCGRTAAVLMDSLSGLLL